MVFLNGQGISVILIKKINKLFIVEFKVGDRHFDLMLIPRINLLIKRGEHSGDDSSIFIVILCSSHSEGLTCPSLSITHDRPRIPFESTGQDFLGADIVDDLLRDIIKHFFELKTPLILLMINNASFNRSLGMNANVTT